jgi:predicted ATPase/DNA-binding SARP family transcriptional activator
MTEEAEAAVSSWDEAAGGTRFGLLGPLLVEVNGVERVVTARRQRSVLACLAVHAGEAVSADRMLDEVWGEETPGTGVKAVAFQISKIRSLLEPVRDGPGSLLITTSAGYLLDVNPDRVDVHHFDRLVTEARDVLPTDPARSEGLIAGALRLWRGRPFADLADESFAEVAGRHLEAGRLLARHTLAEARIAQGRHTEAIGDLEVIAAEQPLEETAVRLLMLALHRSGRTADALRAYGELRLRLGSELGIEPSRDLQRLEQQLLADEVERPAISVPEPADGTGTQGNLPTPLSTFVGRTEEIGTISEMLTSKRLVSLVSFGGAGKTRLAIEVARNLADRFDGGAWFVDLVPISEPSPLADTFAAGVGLRATLDGDPAEYLLSQLANRNALIVVDNCEHLIDAVADLVERLVRAAPEVRVLATSRLPLGVPGESVWHVQPLAIVSASSELFGNRARLVRPGFVVDDTNRAVVEQVCERLDGIPLAIELATARLKTMTVQQIAEHLDDRFGLLTSAVRGADDRQRSLHATMKWSYDLLDEPDRALLRALSVFSDGCTFDAAAEIGRHSFDGDEGPSSIDVLDDVGRLVDASLLAFDETADPPRYRVLETVREFAADQLDHDEQHQLRDAHARYFSTVAARVDELYFVDHQASLGLGDQEVGNLRSAINWAYTNGNPRLGMLIAIHLWSYFWSRTLNRENVRWGITALKMIDDDDDNVMRCAAGTIVDAYNSADRDSGALAEERLRRGLRTIDDPAIRSRALMALAVSVMDFDPRGAESLLEDAWLAAPARPRSISLLNNRIEQSWLTGTWDDGDTILRRLDEILALVPEPPQAAVKIQAGVAACAGQWDEVVRLTDNYAQFDEAPRGDLRLLRSEALGALGRTDEALTVIPPLGVDDYASYIRDVHMVIAPIDLAREDVAAALHRLTVLGDMISRDGRRLAIAMQVAAFLAVAAHDLEQDETAAILFGFAAGERARLDIVLRPSVRPLVERALDACHAALGGERFDELAEIGAGKEWADLPVVIAAPTLTGL